jgi:ubiquitin-protein ligase
MSIRDHRINAEWEMLEDLVEANRTTFAFIIRLKDQFLVQMQESPAWIEGATEPRIETVHALRYIYPRFYPTLPLEGYFVRPIQHVNVDPVTGFVCLWLHFRPAQTIIDAILTTRSILAGKTANWGPEHRMGQSPAAQASAFSMPPLVIPMSCQPQTLRGSHRIKRRISDLDSAAPSESECAFSDTQ